jgi:hypothetical protein
MYSLFLKKIFCLACKYFSFSANLPPFSGPSASVKISVVRLLQVLFHDACMMVF